MYLISLECHFLASLFRVIINNARIGNSPDQLGKAVGYSAAEGRIYSENNDNLTFVEFQYTIAEGGRLLVNFFFLWRELRCKLKYITKKNIF